MSIKFSLQDTNKSKAEQPLFKEWTACRAGSFWLTRGESQRDFMRVVRNRLNPCHTVIEGIRNRELLFDFINCRGIDGITNPEANTETENVTIIRMDI